MTRSKSSPPSMLCRETKKQSRAKEIYEYMLWDWIIDFRHWHTYSSSTHVIVVPSSKASYNWMMRGLCKPLIISISRSILRRSSLHVHLTNLAAKRKPVVFSLHVYTVPYVPLFIFAFKKENNGKSFSFRYFFLFLFSPWKKPHYLPNSFFDISYVSFGSTFRWISTKRYGKHTSISAKKNKMHCDFESVKMMSWSIYFFACWFLPVRDRMPNNTSNYYFQVQNIIILNIIIKRWIWKSKRMPTSFFLNFRLDFWFYYSNHHCCWCHQKPVISQGVQHHHSVELNEIDFEIRPTLTNSHIITFINK